MPFLFYGFGVAERRGFVLYDTQAGVFENALRFGMA